MDSLPQKLTRRIRSKGRGWVFTAKDFLDLGTRDGVAQALSRMTKDGHIRRLKYGLYDFPKIDRTLGLISPHPDDVAAALARRTGDKIYPAGADAANMLRLSTQVPAQLVYLTTGASKTYTIGKQIIQLKHSSLSAVLDLTRRARLAVTAMLYFGKNGVDDEIVDSLRECLDQADKRKLAGAINVLPTWLAPKVKAITA